MDGAKGLYKVLGEWCWGVDAVVKKPVVAVVQYYDFVENNPVANYDFLGLCCCGDDVTLLMTQTELDLQQTFNPLPYYRKVLACDWLFSPAGLFNWDIDWLLGYKAPVNSETACQPCWRTVTYAGRCMYNSDLNYVFFGWAMQVCRQDPDTLDMLWRALWWRPRWLGGDDVASINRKVAAAEYGFTGDGSLLDSMRAPVSCAPSNIKGNANPRNWYWATLRRAMRR